MRRIYLWQWIDLCYSVKRKGKPKWKWQVDLNDRRCCGEDYRPDRTWYRRRESAIKAAAVWVACQWGLSLLDVITEGGEYTIRYLGLKRITRPVHTKNRRKIRSTRVW